MKNFLTRLSPGMRTIKTALAIIVCLLLYYVGNHYGVADRSDVFLACISAIICMQDSVEKSVKSGLNRLWGTLIGAALGLLYSLIGLNFDHFLLMLVTVSAGVIILIILCNVLKLYDSIIIGCVVFLFIAMQQTDADPLVHCIKRFIDTGIGIFVSVVINHFVLNPKKSNKSQL